MTESRVCAVDECDEPAREDCAECEWHSLTRRTHPGYRDRMQRNYPNRGA